MRGMVNPVPGLRQYLGRMPKPVHDGGCYVETMDVDVHVFREDNPPLIGPMVVKGFAADESCVRWIVGDELPEQAGRLSVRRYG